MNVAEETPAIGISVAMATYNGAIYLRDQLDSIARQTLLPMEIVVTDDGSTDDTLQVIEEFAAGADFPVRVFRNEQRLGYGDNFLRAASLCRGTLIAFSDQDDVWEPQKLARCAVVFEDPEVLLCVHAARVWDGTTASDQLYPALQTTGVFSPPSLDPFQLMPGFAMMVRADLLQLTSNSPRPRHMLSLGSKPVSQAHDDWIYFLAVTTGKVARINESLALYRQHGTNVVGAPEATSVQRSVSFALSDWQYAEMADLEGEYATLAETLSSRLPSPRREYALATSRNLQFRSACHRLRADIYAPRASFFQRAAGFLRLVTKGAYRTDPSRARLGPRAAVKDLLFGVPGVYRWRASSRRH